MMRQSYDGRAIIFDCDDVLLDWNEGFCRWMGALNRIHLDPAGPSNWDMDEWVGQPAMPFVERFNASWTFGSLKPCKGAKKAVADLYAAGYSLHVISSCSEDERTIRNREKNLDAVFGDVFSSIICLPLGSSKHEPLSQIAKSQSQKPIWIEDNFYNAVDGADLGMSAFVMRRSHNRLTEEKFRSKSNPIWIDDFGPVFEHLQPQLQLDLGSPERIEYVA